MKGLLFAAIWLAGLGCAPIEERGPFEIIESKVWKIVNRNHRGQDGIYVQAILRTFAYELSQLYSRAEREGLDHEQLESRVREQLIYPFIDGRYPAADGTDINNLYLQYLVYINKSFDPTNPMQKKVFDTWRAEYVRRLLAKLYDSKFQLLRRDYDARWGMTLYSRLVFTVLVENVESELKPQIADIGNRTFLVDEDGQRYSPSGMAGPYPYNFDRPREEQLDGRLIYRVFFPNRKADHKTPIIGSNAQYLALEIEGLGDEPVRRLRWDLPLTFPEAPYRRLPDPVPDTTAAP